VKYIKNYYHKRLQSGHQEEERERERAADLTAKLASILSVLGDLDLLDLLTQAGTITSTVLTDNADLLRSLTLNSDEEPGSEIHSSRSSTDLQNAQLTQSDR
jgi:hypothetical protein